MTTVRKVKSFKQDAVPPSQMIWRAMEILPSTANDEAKSVDVVIASDNPVERWDDRRGGVVAEVLDMGGVVYRGNKTQLPIVDSHDRSTIRNVLGSVRNIRTENGQLVGTATFARDGDSQQAYEKLRDGHLTDFSITATPIESQFVPRGEITRVGDRQIEGPADIVTRWMPTDASLVAVGADETSTVRDVRRSYLELNRKGVTRMLTEEMKAALVAKGMPEQLADTEQALAWAIGVLGAAQPNEAAAEPEAMPEPVEMADEPMAEDKPEEAPAEEDKKEEIQKALNADKARRKEIVALCTQAKIERAFADALCDEGLSLDAARSKVLERLMESKPVGTSAGRIEAVASADDKRYAAMRDGLIARAFIGAGVKSKPFADNKPAQGSEDFRFASLLRMAEITLRAQGVNTDRMPPRDIAMAAMGNRSVMERYGIRRDVYHTTGSFPQLMLDASNKTLLAGYDEAPYTWTMWARQANSVPDFKNINRVRFSEAPDLEMIPERHEYKEKSHSDQKETYKVEKYGSLFSVSWETVVNDDLDAISRIPAMHGVAARRKQNKAVYNVLTSNPTMSDSYSLFSASHASGSNYTSSGTAISVTSLNVAFALMMVQKGISSDVVINVQPRYLIVPAGIAATALQVVTSVSDPAAGGSAVGNANTNNIYGPNGVRPLQVVVDPVLDADDTNGWYLAADPSQIDTVELAFLQGEESPVLESEWDFRRDAYEYKVRQTFGVAAIDWRGLYHNEGA